MSGWIDPWPRLPEEAPDNAGNRVAMFHVGRAGSSVLSGMIRQYNEETIYWEGEIFGRRMADHYTQFGIADPLALIAFRSGRCSSKFYGLETKMLPGQDLEALDGGYDPGSYVGFLKKRGFEKMILLERKNILEQIVSFAIGMRTGKWHYVSGDALDVEPLELDVQRVILGKHPLDLTSAIRQVESVIAHLKPLLPEGVLTLTYEDDVLPDPQIGYRRIVEFLGLPRREAVVRFVKGNSLPLRERLSNFEEVRNLLKDTSYEWMCG